MDQLIFALLGVVGKLAGGLLSVWVDSRREDRQREHEFRLAALKSKERPFDPGFDVAHDSTRLTRRMLALVVVGTVSTIAVYGALNPATTFTIPTAYSGGIFDWLFGTREESTIKISLGWFTMRYIELAFMAAGFYFTPVGKKQ